MNYEEYLRIWGMVIHPSILGSKISLILLLIIVCFFVREVILLGGQFGRLLSRELGKFSTFFDP